MNGSVMSADTPCGVAAVQSGALDREEYQAIVANLDTVPMMACPNFRLLRRQHPG